MVRKLKKKIKKKKLKRKIRSLLGEGVAPSGLEGYRAAERRQQGYLREVGF